MPIEFCMFTRNIKLLLFIPENREVHQVTNGDAYCLTNLFDNKISADIIITASQATTRFFLFTFFGFSSILFSHFTPSLCHSYVRRSIASSSQSNLQSIDSSPRESASIKINSDSSDSVELNTPTENKSSKTIRLSTPGSTSTIHSTTFPPILSTRFMHFIMQTSLLSRLVGAHIGEPCNSLFKICLPPSPHIYCDDNLICRCRDEYPVEIQPHTCKLPRKIGDRCSHSKECSYLDPFAYCTKGYNFSECQCREGYLYSYSDEKCVQGKATKSKPRTAEKIFLPSSIVFFLGCFGLICCTLLVWYMFCQSPRGDIQADSRFPPAFDSQLDPLNPSSRNGRTNTGRPDGGGGRGSRGYNRTGGLSRPRPDSSGGLRGSLLPHQLPSYDVAVYNQPPPSYDEAVKDTASAPTCNAERDNSKSNQLAHSIVDEALTSTNVVRSSGMISLTLSNNCTNNASAPPVFAPSAPDSYAPGQTVSTGNIDRSSDSIQPFVSIQSQRQSAPNTADSTCITLPTSRI